MDTCGRRRSNTHISLLERSLVQFFFMNEICTCFSCQFYSRIIMMENGKRKEVSTSSDSEEVEKRAKVEEEMPNWAKMMFTQIQESNRQNTNQIVATVNELKNDIGKIQESVEIVEQRCNDIEEKHFETSAEVEELRKEVKGLKLDLASQTDRGLRNSLTIHNIPYSKERETWNETEAVLATFLSKNVSTADWGSRIERAHRGRTTVIHVMFKHYEFAEEIRDKFMEKGGKINNNFVNDKFSEHTQERRQRAYEARKKYRLENPTSKLYIKYPASLMCKDFGDRSYRVMQQF